MRGITKFLNFVHILCEKFGQISHLSTGSQTFQQHRQVVDEDHDPRPRDAQRGAVLCGRGYADSVVATFVRTTRALSEVSHWVSVCLSVFLYLLHHFS